MKVLVADVKLLQSARMIDHTGSCSNGDDPRDDKIKKTTGCGVLRRGKRLQAVQEKSSSASPRKRRRTKKAKLKTAKINGKEAGTEYDNAETDNKKNKTRYIQLSAAEKKSEAYQRLEKIGGLQPQLATKTTNSSDNGNNIWKAPRSSHHLIQEDHAFDPWKVLIICILLNKTTGFQVRQGIASSPCDRVQLYYQLVHNYKLESQEVREILSDLFLLCPNAEAATKVPKVKIEETIRSLGFHRRRAKIIKRFSHEYLQSEWTHVTQLHGIGKYAADAYAIFCVGKPEEVIPHDHKLVDYWNFICGKNGAELSGQENLLLSSVPNCVNEKIVEHQISGEDQQDKC